MGDNLGGVYWETSGGKRSCGPKHPEHTECTGRQVGDKPEIMRAENPERSRKTGAKSCGPRTGTQALSAQNDKRGTSAESCGPKHSDQPVCTGGDKLEKSCGQRIESVVGDSWETSAKSCRPNQSIQSVLGDEWRQVGDENWETGGRQVGDKCEITRAKALRASRVYWGTSGRQVEVKLEITQAENLECSGRQVQHHVDQSTQRIHIFFCRKQTKKTPNHADQARTPCKGVKTTHRQTCLGKKPFHFLTGKITDKFIGAGIQSGLGDKRETSGDKWET